MNPSPMYDIEQSLRLPISEHRTNKQTNERNTQYMLQNRVQLSFVFLGVNSGWFLLQSARYYKCHSQSEPAKASRGLYKTTVNLVGHFVTRFKPNLMKNIRIQQIYSCVYFAEWHNSVDETHTEGFLWNTKLNLITITWNVIGTLYAILLSTIGTKLVRCWTIAVRNLLKFLRNTIPTWSNIDHQWAYA